MTITIRQASIIGKATLVSAEISSISFPNTPAPRSKTQSAAPYSLDGISSTHSSMPLLESIPSENYDELPLPIPPHFAPRLSSYETARDARIAREVDAALQFYKSRDALEADYSTAEPEALGKHKLHRYSFSESQTPHFINVFDSNKEIAEEHWLSNTKHQEISHQTLKQFFQPALSSDLSFSQKSKLESLLLSHSFLFQNKSGTTPLISHKIENSKTVFDKPRRLSQFEYEKAETLKNDMLQQGVIRESSSPYNSPILMVTKKDGSIRFCVDYRQLNKVTKTCKYPLSNPYSCFEKLHNAYYFTSLDLVSAYWSIPMSEEDKEKTAFTLRSGKYEFNVMPFGLTNAVATFCALMDKLFSPFQWDFVLCFIDDCLIFTPNDFDLHLTQLHKVLSRLESANMRLKLSKCKFAVAELPFLGHIIGRSGLKMDPQI